MNPIPDPNYQLAHLRSALSATGEVAAMIDITHAARADRWPPFERTEGGRFLLALRPDLEALAVELAASIERFDAGLPLETNARQLAAIAHASEERIRAVRLILDRACAP